MQRRETLRLLVVDERRDRADALVNRVRLSGMALRARWVRGRAALERALREQPWDIVVASLPNDDPALVAIPEMLSRIPGRHGAILGVEHEGHADAMTPVSGVDDIVDGGTPGRFEHATARAFDGVRARRAVERLTRALRASERAARDLVNLSPLPTALTDGDAVVHANLAFSDLLGLEPEDPLEGRPVSDLLLSGESEELHELLSDTNPVLQEVATSFEHPRRGRVAITIEVAPLTLGLRHLKRMTFTPVDTAGGRESEREGPRKAARAPPLRRAGPDLAEATPPDSSRAPSPPPQGHRNAALAQSVSRALTDGRMSLVYQPIVRFHGEPFEFYEAFLRLVDDAGKPIAPRSFLAAAEAVGESSAIDTWLIHRIVDVAAARRAAGHETKLFFKVTNAALHDVGIALELRRRLRAAGLPAGSLVAEVSETGAVADLRAARGFVTAVRELGCGVALDHFGISLESFELLSEVPADYVKIDPDVVAHIVEDEHARNELRALAEQARTLDKHLIATCVDGPALLPVLYACGVEFGQGHCISAPAPEMDYEFTIELETSEPHP